MLLFQPFPTDVLKSCLIRAKIGFGASYFQSDVFALFRLKSRASVAFGYVSAKMKKNDSSRWKVRWKNLDI